VRINNSKLTVTHNQETVNTRMLTVSGMSNRSDHNHIKSEVHMVFTQA